MRTRINARLLASGNYALTERHGRCERVVEILTAEELDAAYEAAAEAANDRFFEERCWF